MSGVRWTEARLAEHQARLGGRPATAGQPLPAPALPKARGKEKLQALGRMKDGAMNGTEAKYAAYLDTLKAAGEVKWYAFEAIKLKLAPNTHLTVDFFVMYADGRLEAHDVKGARAIVEDDSKAKIKIAADTFPWPFKLVFPRKAKDGSGWDVEAI